jgi:Na+/phosphate symporter
MVSIGIPFLVAVIGALLFCFAKSGKAQTLGLVLFAVGMFYVMPQITAQVGVSPRR